MKLVRRGVAIWVVLALALPLAPGLMAQGAPEEIDIEQISPAQMHQYLGRQKAAALESARQRVEAAAAYQAESQTDYDVTWYDITIRVDDSFFTAR
jgi:hypothetical protein